MMVDAGASPAAAAVILISPGCFNACTNAMHSPLKALRLPSLDERGLSDSWQLGSPLPKPIRLLGPVILKPTSLPAIGISRPWASRTSTVMMDKSSPSAAIFCRSVLRASLPGAPVVSRFSISTTRPDDEPRASSTPGAYFTFHSTCELRSICFACCHSSRGRGQSSFQKIATCPDRHRIPQSINCPPFTSIVSPTT